MTLDDLLAREAIRDVLARYCRGIDRRDRSLVAGCFHADATDDHGTGPRPIDEFLDWCFDLVAGYDSSFHFLGQTVIDVDGGGRRAWVESYGIAHHRTAGGPDRRNLITGFRYVDQFRVVDGVWGITHRTAITDWSRIDRAADWWDVPDRMLQGRSGPDDPSYG
jgi:hypothetical protein